MAGRSAVLAIRILADGQPARREFSATERASAGSTSKIKGHYTKLAAAIGGAFAAEKIGGFLVDSVKGYQDHLTVLKQTAQVVKTTGGAAKVTAGHVSKLADSVEAYTGVDGDLIQKGANMLLTFTNIRNEVGKNNDIFDQATKITTDMSAALGTDLSKQAVQVGKALNDPIKGVSALSKVGVSFTQQQKDQIKAMVGANNTLGAQKLILGELGKEFGGTAHAIETPTQAMAVQFHALQDQIGSILLPVITALMHVLTAYVLPVIIAIIGWVKENARVIGLVALAISPLVAAWGAYVLITKAVALYQGIVNAVMEANPIVLVVTAIGLLVAAFIVAYNKIKIFREIVDAVFGVLRTIVTAAVKGAWTVIKTYVDLWLGAFRVARTVIGAVFGAIRTAVSTAAGAIRTAIGWIGSAIRGAWHSVQSIGGNILGFFRGLPGKIAGFAGNMAKAAGEFMGRFWDGIKNAAKAAGGAAVDMAKTIVNAIINGLNSILGLPWTIKLHIDIPFAPDVNFGPYTVLPRIPLWGSADGGALPAGGINWDDLTPGFTLMADAITWPSTSFGGRGGTYVTRQGDTIVKAVFPGLVTDPEGVARSIRGVIRHSDDRNGLTREPV